MRYDMVQSGKFIVGFAPAYAGSFFYFVMICSVL